MHGMAAKPVSGCTRMLAGIPLTAKMALICVAPPAGLENVMEATGWVRPKAARLIVVW